MREILGKQSFQTLAVVLLLSAGAAQASGLNAVNGGMPNRISMNVTVPKQTQGATFGEKVNAGLHAARRGVDTDSSAIVVECGQAACAVLFPDGGTRADLASMSFSPIASRQASELRKGSPGASLLGGAIPGGAILSAAFTAAPPTMSSDAAAAATGRAVEVAAIPTRTTAPGVIDPLAALPDGDYLLTLEVEPASAGLKDTLKTQVRAPQPQPQRVRIVVGFTVEAGMPKAKHDTAKNSIGNVR